MVLRRMYAPTIAVAPVPGHRMVTVGTEVQPAPGWGSTVMAVTTPPDTVAVAAGAVVQPRAGESDGRSGGITASSGNHLNTRERAVIVDVSHVIVLELHEGVGVSLVVGGIVSGLGSNDIGLGCLEEPRCSAVR